MQSPMHALADALPRGAPQARGQTHVVKAKALARVQREFFQP